MSIFSDLLDFVQNRMHMSHIYQPVMLTTLIKGGGIHNALPAKTPWWEQK